MVLLGIQNFVQNRINVYKKKHYDENETKRVI